MFDCLSNYREVGLEAQVFFHQTFLRSNLVSVLRGSKKPKPSKKPEKKQQ